MRFAPNHLQEKPFPSSGIGMISFKGLFQASVEELFWPPGLFCHKQEELGLSLRDMV